jgi:hypothetical protein
MKQPINEIKRMQQLAGLITESQLNELSPELLQRAGEKAAAQGRKVQAAKFWGAATGAKLKAAAKDTEAKLEPVKPFVGKLINFYFNIKDKGFASIEVPHKMSNIYEDKNNVWIIVLTQDSNKDIPDNRIMGYKMDTGFYVMGSENWGGPNYQTAGIDQPGAQLLVKLAKAVKPDADINPNNIVNGQPTPIAGKAFVPAAPQQESQLSEYDEYDDIEEPEFDDDHDIEAQKKFEDMIVDVPRLHQLMSSSMYKNGSTVTVNGVEVVSMGNTGRMTLEDGTKLNSNDFANRVPDIKIDGEPIDIPMTSSKPPAPLNYKSSNVYPPGSYMDEVVNNALKEHRRKQK